MKTVCLFLFTAISVGYSVGAQAEEACTLKVILRNFSRTITTAELMTLVNQVTDSTNIKIAENQTDYSLEIYMTDSIDHHNTRFVRSSGSIELWPSKQVQDRSSYSIDSGTNFMRKRKFNKPMLENHLTQILKQYLTSCANLDKVIKSTGNGTLNPVDGERYTTQRGFVFERVGSYWKDPAGLQWGEILAGEYTNAGIDSPAVKACEAIGARLPTIEEYDRLMTYFSPSNNRNRILSPEGLYELNALFPWSSGMYTTATRSDNGVGYDFHHDVGSGSPALAHWELNVRCVK